MTDLYEALLGKTLSGGGGGSATLITKSITANGTYDAIDDEADGYSAVNVEVPNTYTQADEGKVVDNGALVSQTSTSTSTNGTVDTTLYNEIVVSVPNTYTAGDEGKVVSNGALVAQTSDTVTTNGTVDTTLISSLLVNVSASGNIAYKLSGDNASDAYIIDCGDYIYIFGTSIWNGSGTSVNKFNYTIPSGFDVSKIGSVVGGWLAAGNYDISLARNASIGISGYDLTLNFTSTQFSKNIDIWTIVRITKST